MNGRAKPSYKFGEYRLIPSERKLLKKDIQIPLAPKAFDVLVVLVENAGELIENKDMLQLVWPDTFVEDANISVQISTIRKVLDERSNGRMIETVPKIGYRLVADVKVSENRNGAVDLQVPEETVTKFIPQPKAGAINASSFLANKALPIVLGMVAVVFLAGAAWILFGFFGQISARTSFAGWSQGMKVVKLTDSGSAFGAAISPDGKYAAYQTMNAGKYSIWLTKLGDSSSVQITPAGDTVYGGITFSPGDDHIYFTAGDNKPNVVSSVYRIPRLGGEAKIILVGTDSPIGFSADGKRFAFIRRYLERGETALMTAGVDGSDERTIATRRSPDSFSIGKRPTFSPDGRTIACIGINSGEKFLRVLTVDTLNGTVNNLTSEKWTALQDVIWQDSDNLLLTAQEDFNFGPLQVWTTSISGGGVAVKLTREINNYVGLSLSSDSRQLLTTHSDAFSNMWMMPNGDSSQAKQILSIKGGGRVEMSWTPNGQIVYTSNASGDSNIYSMNADGSDQVQLTSDSFVKRSPVVSPDSRYIVFVSNQTGPEQIWRMNIDGQNRRQLGIDHVYRYPQFSPDGRWLVYSTWKDKKAYIWKLSVEGGEPELLRGDLSFTPNVSPDIKSIAYMAKDEKTGQSNINITSITGGAPFRSLDVPATTSSDSIRWSPDSRGVIYRAPFNNAINFWLRPIGDAEPKRLTDFTYDFPIYCSLSRDMKQLSCLRNTLITDIIHLSVP